MKAIKVETESGKYLIKKPTGQIGYTSFNIMFGLSKYASDPNNEDGMSPLQLEEAEEALRKTSETWCREILPHIVLEEEGYIPYEDIEGHDQFAIFMAVYSTAKMGEELFRIIE